MASWAREDNFFMAIVAEKADRFEDMAEFMEKLVSSLPEGEELSSEERDLLTLAYKNVVSPLRASWRTVSSIELKEEGSGESDRVAAACDYRFRIEADLSSACSRILRLLESPLASSVSNSESMVYYHKMKGNFSRYLTEFKTGVEKKEAADSTLDSYTAAQEIAAAELPSTHPLRLGLALNFSVFFYEILNSPERACNMAKQAFDEAIADLNSIEEKSYKDNNFIMQLIRDNLTHWNSDVQVSSILL